MTATDVLIRNGIKANADALVAAASRTGVPLHIAAAFVQQESGGLNVYGHDAGGAMSGAGEVTAANFARFFRLISTGHTSNGVGPLQITYGGYFPQAAAQGLKLWVPLDNMVFGLGIIRGYLNGKSDDAAINAAGQRYNSGRPGGAPVYGASVLAHAKRWGALLNTPANLPPKEKPTMTVTANGWPVKETGRVNFTAPNRQATSVANQSLAHLFSYAAYRWDTEMEPVTSCWGARTIAEQRQANPAVGDSNHMSATAIDINGARHPYELTHRSQWDSFTGGQMATYRDIIAQTRVLQTGMDFASPYRDGMHLQVRENANHQGRPVTDAMVHEAAVRIRDWAKGVQRLVGVPQDGMMGPGTKSAVLAFQAKHGLTADGIVGAKTRAAADHKSTGPVAPIKPPARPAPTYGNVGTSNAGDKGARVTSLQAFLLHKGFHEVGKADGDYGPKTVAAVKRYQEIVGLGVDGVVGPRTLAVMKARGWK